MPAGPARGDGGLLGFRLPGAASGAASAGHVHASRTRTLTGVMVVAKSEFCLQRSEAGVPGPDSPIPTTANTGHPTRCAAHRRSDRPAPVRRRPPSPSSADGGLRSRTTTRSRLSRRVPAQRGPGNGPHPPLRVHMAGRTTVLRRPALNGRGTRARGAPRPSRHGCTPSRLSFEHPSNRLDFIFELLTPPTSAHAWMSSRES